MMIKTSSLLRLSKAGFFFGASLLFTSTAAMASNALLDFSESLKSFRASFTQTVYDSDSVVLQESTGIVELARPGRFKWTYDAPISQVIIADGLTLWVYDEEIKQVTKQPQATTLGSAPIGLLSGQRDIESEFVIEVLGQKDDLEWFQLQPLVSDTDFNEIFLALNDGGLHAMELRDNFGQATQIVFSDFEKNVFLDSEQFSFVVPQGVDVVGEGGTPEDQDEPAEPSINTDPLLVDDTDPLLDDTPADDIAAPGAAHGTAPAVEDSTLEDIAPANTFRDEAPVTDVESDSPRDDLTRDDPNSDPNSDDELLASDPVEQSPAQSIESTDDQIARPDAASDSATDSVTPSATDEAPQPDNNDSDREIIFQERKVTN